MSRLYLPRQWLFRQPPRKLRFGNEAAGCAGSAGASAPGCVSSEPVRNGRHTFSAIAETLVKCQSSFRVVGNPSATKRCIAARRFGCSHRAVGSASMKCAKSSSYWCVAGSAESCAPRRASACASAAIASARDSNTPSRTSSRASSGRSTIDSGNTTGISATVTRSLPQAR